ncbi:MAG: glycosyltransferase [Microbacteriaceae bacterium]|nr:glycosyltransferase [Microbacteriaceae bacterium]
MTGEGLDTGQPTVSVVIATYRSSYLTETLASVISQTHHELEILVLDDANEPECRDLVAAMGDSRLRYIANQNSLGPALNHAKGISEATGSYIALVNHDDILEPSALERFVAALSAVPEAVAAFSRPRVILADGTEDSKKTEQAWATWNLVDIPNGVINEWTRLGMRLAFPINPSAVFRAHVIKDIGVPKAVGGSYDYWVAYRAARLGPVIHVPEAIGYWREHDGNLTIVRSAARTFERVYLDGHLIFDAGLSLRERSRALGRLPRSIGAWLRDILRSRRAATHTSARS